MITCTWKHVKYMLHSKENIETKQIVSLTSENGQTSSKRSFVLKKKPKVAEKARFFATEK